MTLYLFIDNLGLSFKKLLIWFVNYTKADTEAGGVVNVKTDRGILNCSVR